MSASSIHDDQVEMVPTAFTHPPPADARSCTSSLRSTPRASSTLTGHSSRSSHRQAPAIPPQPDRGIPAWRFLFGCFLVETIIWGFPVSYGVLLDAYARLPVAETPGAGTLLPLVGTLSSGLMYLVSNFVFAALDRRPDMRVPCLWIGCVICAGSLGAASFATSAWELVLTQGVMYAIGGALVYYTTIIFLNEWFVERRGFANGVVFAGTALGGLFFPFVFDMLIQRYGVPTCLRILGVAVFVSLASVLPLVKPRLPYRRSQITTSTVVTAAIAAGRDPTLVETEVAEVEVPTIPQRDGTLKILSNLPVRSGTMWLFLIANFFQSLGYFIPALYIPTFARALGLSASNGTAALAAINAAAVVSRLLMGFLSDRISPHMLGGVTLLTSSLAILLLWGVASVNLVALISFSVAFGAVSGGWTSLWSANIKEIVAEDKPSSLALYGLLSTTRGLGNVLVAPISAALLQHPLHLHSAPDTGLGTDGGSFANVILFAGAMMLASAVLETAGMWVRRRQKVE
ncbi:hypothetical protein HKX48_005742 [Thoreauomyces humboldtii]|nr:hypothetical protein HKX48_005742 [Thoreauomyces humboldtii]